MEQTGSYFGHLSLNFYLEYWIYLHLFYRLPLVLFIGSSSNASIFSALYIIYFISNSFMSYDFKTVLVFLYNSAIQIYLIDLWDLDSLSPHLVYLSWCWAQHLHVYVHNTCMLNTCTIYISNVYFIRCWCIMLRDYKSLSL